MISESFYNWEIPLNIDISEDIFIKYLQEHHHVIKEAGYVTDSVRYGQSIGYDNIDLLINDNIITKYSRDHYAWLTTSGKYQVTFFRKISLLDKLRYFFVEDKYKIVKYQILYFYTDNISMPAIRICNNDESPWVYLGMDNSMWCGKCFGCIYIITNNIRNIADSKH